MRCDIGICWIWIVQHVKKIPLMLEYCVVIYIEPWIFLRKNLRICAIIHVKKPHLLWKHPMSYSWVSSLAGPYTRFSEVNGTFQWTFLTSWPWPLTYDLPIQLWPRYSSTWPTCQNSSLYVCPFGHESGNTQTDTYTNRRCQNYYTQHVRNVGRNKIITVAWWATWYSRTINTLTLNFSDIIMKQCLTCLISLE